MVMEGSLDTVGQGEGVGVQGGQAEGEGNLLCAGFITSSIQRFVWKEMMGKDGKDTHLLNTGCWDVPCFGPRREFPMNCQILPLHPLIEQF